MGAIYQIFITRFGGKHSLLELCHLKIFLNIFEELLFRVRTKPIKREEPGKII